jgi:hypothetical protein
MEFRRASEELEAAREALQKMENDPPIMEMRRAWQEFIDRIEKTWNKLKLECDKVGNRAALDAASNLRKTDPMLRYLSQARHADQHTLQSSTMFGLGFKISLPPGAEFHIDFIHGTASSKGADVSLRVGKPVYCLLPIVNRGISCDPPAEHLGKALGDVTPITVARLAFEFYRSLVDKAIGESTA